MNFRINFPFQLILVSAVGSDIEARLRSVLGLNKYQALAYEALLKSGPMKAQEVARLTGIPQQRIYDTLRSLVDAGLVTERDGGAEGPVGRREGKAPRHDAEGHGNGNGGRD